MAATNVVTQGTVTPAGVVNFNPNTGAALTSGQSVNVNAGGNTYGSTLVNAPTNGNPNPVNPNIGGANGGNSGIPVPAYGSDVKDANGVVVGKAMFNPNTGAPLQPNASNGIGSSTTTRNSESDLVASLKSMFAGYTTDPALTSAHSDAVSAFTNYSKALQDQYDAQTKSINGDFDTQNSSLKDTQNRENGQTRSGVLRMGGYLGDSGSGQGVMTTLAAAHQSQITALEGKRQSALLAAQSAIQDKQFATASALASEAKGYADDIETRKNNFFNQAIQMSTMEQTQIKDQLTALSTISDPSTIPQDTKDKIDSYYHVPGFTDSYVKAAQAAKQKDAAEAQKSYVDLLKDIPAGQSVQMPDGSTVTGIGSSSDMEVFNKEDANGNVTVVAFDKASGKIKEYGAGKIGTPSSTGAGAVPTTEMSNTATAFSQLPRDANGFISTVNGQTPAQIYNTLYNTFVQRNPGKGKWFLDNYPIENQLGGENAQVFKGIGG